MKVPLEFEAESPWAKVYLLSALLFEVPTAKMYVYYMRKCRESNLFSTPNLASIISYDECIRMYMYVIHCTYLARLPLYSEVLLKAFQI